MQKNRSKTLNLRQAYELYLLIKDVYPEDETELSEFIMSMLRDIRDTRPAILTEMLAMFTDDEITEPGLMLVTLVAGMEHNKIADLYSFFKTVTNGN